MVVFRWGIGLKSSAESVRTTIQTSTSTRPAIAASSWLNSQFVHDRRQHRPSCLERHDCVSLAKDSRSGVELWTCAHSMIPLLTTPTAHQLPCFVRHSGARGTRTPDNILRCGGCSDAVREGSEEHWLWSFGRFSRPGAPWERRVGLP